MIETAAALTVIVLLGSGSAGGWSGAFGVLFQAGILLAIPLGLHGLFGAVGGWIGVGLLGALAVACVAQGVARLVEWWHGGEEPVGDDHF